MRKTKLVKKSLIKHLSLFIAIQLAMFYTTVFFAGGGHGTGIPAIIFYGPLLKIPVPEIIRDNVLLSFALLFLILFGLFIAVWLEYIGKKALLYIATSYILISIGILIYTEYSGLGLGSSRISLEIKVVAGSIAAIIATTFWRILFDLINREKPQSRKFDF